MTDFEYLDRELGKSIKSSVTDERERCIKIVERLFCHQDEDLDNGYGCFSAHIRKNGEIIFDGRCNFCVAVASIKEPNAAP